jgi:hypothetical protein
MLTPVSSKAGASRVVGVEQAGFERQLWAQLLLSVWVFGFS